jgi:magnesium-transporting ATPase (P-type)
VVSESPKETSVDETPLETYAKTGLSSEEVERKRQQYGSNEIPEKKVNPIRKFLGYFWERPLPAKILFFTAESTQVFGTLIAVFGVFMAPLGWGLAGLVWGYALLSFFITDSLKIRYFRLMRHGDVKLQR